MTNNMKRSGLSFVLPMLVMAVFFSGLSKASAQSEGNTRTLNIAIPSASSQAIKKPASDLVKDGQVLDVGEAARLAEDGMDLSNLNPVENKLWQNQVYSATDSADGKYPDAQTGVQFLSFEASTKFSSMARVQSLEDPNQFYRLAISRFSQPMMMRAALLRKLGYFLPSPQYYKNLKVRFESEEAKKAFIEQSEMDAGDFTSRGWILADRVQDHSLVLASSTLEQVSFDYFDANWGLAPNPDIPEQVASVQRFSRYRAFRALIFPYALVDVPESVNRYSVRFATVTTGFLSIPYFMAQSFQACGYDDALWILKRIQKLTTQDLREIVLEGHYPPEISDLVYAKLVHRINDALSLFHLSPGIPNPELAFTTPSGLIQKGKVTKEFVPGYPQRFAHGERTSPYQEGDFARYLSVEGKSALLATIFTKLNKQLQAATVQDAASNYQQNLFQKLLQQVKDHPNEPFQKEVASWGGPLAGFNVVASRHISTGTYSGSTAPVQLVDNLSLGAGLGIFRAIDGLGSITPVAGASVSVVRDFTHVRPLNLVKEAKNISWTQLMIPSFMKNISEVLSTADKKNTDGSVQKSLDAFLMDLRDGEVFTISDSIALSAYVQASASMDMMFGMSPLGFLNSLTLSADGSRVILRQVSFIRVSNNGFNGVHVYVRDMKNKAYGLEMNVNFFMNLLKLRTQMTDADIISDGFVIDYNPSLSAEVDPSTETGQKLEKTREDLRLALLPLFRNNNTELLYAKFSNKKFVIEHNLKAKEQKLKFLLWKASRFKEDHLLQITYPRSEAHPEMDPADEKVILFTSKRGKLQGRDLLGMGFDLLQGVLSKFVKNGATVSPAIGDNPANVPYGKAYWRQAEVETDLSPQVQSRYPSVGSIQHVWGGWSLTQKKFFQVLDEIKEQFQGIPNTPYDLINKDEFVNMTSLDFYRITANVSILSPGLDKIRDLILQPNVINKNPAKRKSNDWKMFTDLMTLLGDGNYEAGKTKYMRSCRLENPIRPKNGNGGIVRPLSSYQGVLYPCLADWIRDLLIQAHTYPSDPKEQVQWLTKIISLLDDKIPLGQVLKYLGSENYVLLVRINGFRTGDEDGDLEYFSNTVGDPNQDFEYAGGLVNLYVKKTGLIPTELDRTLGGFQ